MVKEPRNTNIGLPDMTAEGKGEITASSWGTDPRDLGLRMEKSPCFRQCRQLHVPGRRPDDVPISVKDRLAVRASNRIIIILTDSIVRITAEDNYVRIYADRPYLHRETLGAILQSLDPLRFVRVHRSHVINICRVRGMTQVDFGSYILSMDDNSQVTSSRRFRPAVQAAFGLGRSRRVRKALDNTD